MGAPRIDKLSNNLLINGNFDFWQRGVGPTQISSVGYVADRWSHTENLATGAATIERSTDVPNSQSTYSAKLTVTAAQASPGAGEISFIQQVIEGLFFRPARGQTLTLSFYIKTSVTGTWYLSFRNNAVDRTLLKSFSITVANTWQKVTIKFTHDETGAGLRVALTLAAGSSWQSSTVDAWQSGQFYGASGMANLFATNGSTLFLSQMKLSIGDLMTDQFSTAGRNYADELRLCQRYYEKNINLTETPGVASSSSTYATSTAGGIIRMSAPFKVLKRASPAFILWNPIAGSSNQVRGEDGSNIAAVANGNESGIFIINTVGGSVNTSYFAGWAADAEL